MGKNSQMYETKYYNLEEEIKCFEIITLVNYYLIHIVERKNYINGIGGFL